jgi:DNA-binding Lrp family transcriptional regulator
MWFVLGTETPAQCTDAIKRIAQATGLPVLDMPKLREFRVQLFFDARLDNADIVAGAGWPTASTVKTTVSSTIAAMDNLDRAIMRATQAGLPLHSQPFADVATQVGATEAEVIERFELWQSNGILRRIAAVPNHYALGYVHNGMTVWNVDDERADALGEKIATLGFVSHCYRRPRHLPGWPYNVFAMVHGRSREQTDQQIKRIADVLGKACHAHDVLWSTRILKKTGLRISE